MSKYRIRIFSDFSTEEGNKKTYESVCQSVFIENYGIDKEIYITADDNYTHAIIMNKAMPRLTVPKERVIGLAFEPPQYLNITPLFVEYAKKYIGKYYIGSTHDLPLLFLPGYGYMWHNIPPELNTIIPFFDRPKIMSIMISNKLNAHGHLYRHQIVNQIFKRNLPIDIFGRGCRLYSHMNDPRLCGEFNEDKEMYENYQYHISIENFKTDCYMSEKIVDPLIRGTIPIYLGATNVNHKFPNSVIVLTGDLQTDISLIMQIIKNPELYKKTLDQTMIRKNINLLRNLDEVFS